MGEWLGWVNEVLLEISPAGRIRCSPRRPGRRAGRPWRTVCIASDMAAVLMSSIRSLVQPFRKRSACIL